MCEDIAPYHDISGLGSVGGVFGEMGVDEEAETREIFKGAEEAAAWVVVDVVGEGAEVCGTVAEGERGPVVRERKNGRDVLAVAAAEFDPGDELEWDGWCGFGRERGCYHDIDARRWEFFSIASRPPSRDSTQLRRPFRRGSHLSKTPAIS